MIMPNDIAKNQTQQTVLNGVSNDLSAKFNGHVQQLTNGPQNVPPNKSPSPADTAQKSLFGGLFGAAMSNNTVKVKALLAQGANVNERNWMTETVLMSVALNGSYINVKTMRLLLEGGADLTATDLYGQTALDIAKKVLNSPAGSIDPKKRRISAIVTLLEKAAAQPGRKFNKAKKLNPTENLIHAIGLGGFASVVKPLLKQGADPNVTNSKGVSALSFVGYYSQLPMANVFECAEIARALVAAGANTSPTAPGNNKDAAKALELIALYPSHEEQQKAIAEAAKTEGKPLTVLIPGNGTELPTSRQHMFYAVQSKRIYDAARELANAGVNAATLIWGYKELFPVNVTKGDYDKTFKDKTFTNQVGWQEQFSPALDYIKNVGPAQQNFVIVGDGALVDEDVKAVTAQARDTLKANSAATIDFVIVGNRVNSLEQLAKSLAEFGTRVNWRILADDQSVAATLKEIAVKRGALVASAPARKPTGPKP
jgi:ankyrin repeat protein